MYSMCLAHHCIFFFSSLDRPLPLVEVTGHALWEVRRRIGGGNDPQFEPSPRPGGEVYELHLTHAFYLLIHIGCFLQFPKKFYNSLNNFWAFSP